MENYSENKNKESKELEASQYLGARESLEASQPPKDFFKALDLLKPYIQEQKQGVIYFLSNDKIIDFSTRPYFHHISGNLPDKEFNQLVEHSKTQTPGDFKKFLRSQGRGLTEVLEELSKPKGIKGIVPLTSEIKEVLQSLPSFKEVYKAHDPEKPHKEFSVFYRS